MKFIFGILLVLAGIAVGLYVGGWIFFIGGIAGLITEIRAEHVDAMKIAINVAKIFFAGFVGWISALLFLIPGIALLEKS